MEITDLLTIMEAKVYAYTDNRGTVTLPYRIYFPRNYNADGAQKYPVAIFLHGAGERGTENVAPVSANIDLFRNLIAQEDCIILAPQCANDRRWVEKDWELGSYTADETPSPMLNAAMSLLKEVLTTEAADVTRVYAIGLSMGAFGTWDMLIREPDLFAAAIASEGAGDPGKAKHIVDVPIWAFHGDADNVVPVSGTRNMVCEIQNAGGNKIKYTEYPGRGHESWPTVWATPELYPWLFAQRKNN